MTEVTVWAGWIGGIAVGVYTLAQLLLTGRPLGVSTGYAEACGVAPRTKDSKPWRLWFLLGIPLGGLLAALTSSGDISASFSVGPMYDAVLPSSIIGKGAVLVAGGILMGWGARLAGGCTSGHAIMGLSLLGWPSAIAAAGFFVGGIISVQLLFRLFGASA